MITIKYGDQASRYTILDDIVIFGGFEGPSSVQRINYRPSLWAVADPLMYWGLPWRSNSRVWILVGMRPPLS
jgi:hypothetical protein